jgi:hypothetical protein
MSDLRTVIAVFPDREIRLGEKGPYEWDRVGKPKEELA